MKTGALTGMLIGVVLLTGCVSSGTHKQTLAELEEARKATAQTASDFDSFKKQTAAETEKLRQERTRLSNELLAAQSMATKAQQALESTTKKLTDSLETQRVLDQRLKAEAAEKGRLEQERAAKEAEIQRLTKTHAELTKSLESEIAKGDIRIKQVRDRLTINMVDRVLFDSGQAQVKLAGLKVLKQVSDILKKVADKQIRIEGHTDNVQIGVKLRERFPTNWELSTARATSVVRFLIEEGGVLRENLSAVGYADTRPVASNDTEDGRTANRRIEIVLYPKDLSEIAGQIKP
jgi:chemotaxis protein MotB